VGAATEKLSVQLAGTNISQEDQRILGVTQQTLTSINGTGFIQTFGKMTLNTNLIGGTLSEGATVYVGLGGQLTTAVPAQGDTVIRVGKLEKIGTEGILFIDVQHGFVANDLDNVNLDGNSVVVTDDTTSSVSSLSGASGSIVYFEGATPAPGLKTFAGILSNEGYSISPNTTYITSLTGFDLVNLGDVQYDTPLSEGDTLVRYEPGGEGDGYWGVPQSNSIKAGTETIERIWESSTSSYNYVFSNVLLAPPNTTGKGDVNTGFVFLSGTNASSTEVVGDNFGKIWVTGPDQDISDGDYLVYFSANDTTSGTAAVQLSNNALGLLQNDTLNGTLSVKQDSTSLDTLYLESAEDSSNAAPIITMQRDSTSPADGDYLGQIKFSGKNSNNGDELYAKITGKTSDVTLGTEDGLIEIAVKNAGSNLITTRFTGDALKLINGNGLEVDGTLDVTGATTLATGSVTATPTTANHIANKSYVDAQIAAIPSYLQVHASGTHTLTSTATEYDVGWADTGTYALSDPGGNLELDPADTPDPAAIHVSGDGVYQIDCTVQSSNASDRVGMVLRLYIDTGSGYTQASELRSSNYASRGTASIVTGSTHLNTLLSLSAGDKIKFTAMGNFASGTTTLTSNGTYLRIVKVG
jgi:hypothetical protein